jgi:hypothetical protein
MTKTQRHARLYGGMSPVQAMKLSIALEEAIIPEVPRYIRGGDFGGERGWRRFVDKVAGRVHWSDEALTDRDTRHHLVELISYTLVELTERGVLVL